MGHSGRRYFQRLFSSALPLSDTLACSESACATLTWIPSTLHPIFSAVPSAIEERCAQPSKTRSPRWFWQSKRNLSEPSWVFSSATLIAWHFRGESVFQAGVRNSKEEESNQAVFTSFTSLVRESRASPKSMKVFSL